MNGMADERKKWMPAMYVAYFGILEKIFNSHGYALCIHGSVVRDFDLVAIPFEDKISSHETVLIDIKQAVGLQKEEIQNFRMHGIEPHGRSCYAIECGGGGYFDISFTPTVQQVKQLIEKQKKDAKDVKKLLGKL